MTLLIGALPLRAEPGLLATRSLYLATTLLCSWPLWLFCRQIWERNWSWPRAILAAAALCYPLGLMCTLSVNWYQNHGNPKPAPFPTLLFSAFAATSPFCILLVWCGLYFGLRQYERQGRVEALARAAELRTLRYQLTPHFLCNTLNGISTLVGEGHTLEARRMIARLGDFLRATLDAAGALEVSLAQEISYLEQYLAIEQTRLGDRLGVHIDLEPGTLDASVPHLLLQPLVENAVQHGVVPFAAGGDVTIRAEERRGRVWLTVSNRCRADGDAVFKLATLPLQEAQPGVGLRNTAERLRVAYGSAASLRYGQEDAQSWTVTIEIPYQAWLKG
jgi:two-component system sensor histidine kinase AlgZ